MSQKQPFITLFAVLLTACTGSRQSEIPPSHPPQDAPAQATKQSVSTAFTFATALSQTLAHAYKLKAIQADVEAKTLQSEALRGISKPWVFINGSAGSYHLTVDMDTSNIQNKINQVGDKIDHALGIPPTMVGLFGLLNRHLSQRIPNPYTITKNGTTGNVAVSAVWPAYTGGKYHALKTFASSRAHEAKSDYDTGFDQLYSTLVERYFGTQLANMAVHIRQMAFQTISRHEHMATRFYQEGLINKVDLLKAKSALATAKSELAKAENKATLAGAGLAELVGHTEAPVTTLFVNGPAVKPLDYYQQQALQHFPGFEKINAKKAQVDAVKTLSKSAFLPNITFFGQHGITGKDPNWFVGMNVNYTLWSGIDRQKMIQAADKQQEQIQAIRTQAQNDIQLLVQKNWLAVHDAVHRFNSFNAQLAMAKEQTRLATRSFQEGLATALDAIDAQTYLAKIRTERAQAAYDYVLNLAKLLESAGLSQTFSDYQTNAPIFIHEVTP